MKYPLPRDKIAAWHTQQVRDFFYEASVLILDVMSNHGTISNSARSIRVWSATIWEYWSINIASNWSFSNSRKNVSTFFSKVFVDFFVYFRPQLKSPSWWSSPTDSFDLSPNQKGLTLCSHSTDKTNRYSPSPLRYCIGVQSSEPFFWKKNLSGCLQNRIPRYLGTALNWPSNGWFFNFFLH